MLKLKVSKLDGFEQFRGHVEVADWCSGVVICIPLSIFFALLYDESVFAKRCIEALCPQLLERALSHPRRLTEFRICIDKQKAQR